MAAVHRAFLAAAITWAALLPLAPLAASQPPPARAWYALAFSIYGLGSFLCHQLPARSFELWSAQLPVCARCTGIYLGGAVAGLVATWLKRETMQVPFKPETTSLGPGFLIGAAALPSVATLLFEWSSGTTPSNVVRALAGAPLGAAVVVTIVAALRARVN